MDGARFEDPRVISGATGGGFGNGSTNKAMMASDVVLKPLATPILDRFKAMVKAREDEVRVSNDQVVFLSSDEIVRMYEILLSELTFNSKPIITDLTIIAGDQREHGEGIADAICARILEVSVEQKLPSLYLLDSIVKNIGRDYVRYFSTRLPEVFCEAYRQVNPNMYTSMRHLFGTWSTVFPSYVLRKIEACLQFSPSLNNQSSGINSVRASESPRPTHGIHVNPKYLEARRQFGDGTADTAGREVLSSRGHAGNTASSLGATKLLPSSAARIARSSSPYGVKHVRSLSPPLDIAMDASPRRSVEQASPSHSGFTYGYGRAAGRHEEASDLQRNILPDDTSQKFETSAYRYSNGVDFQRPRALIDAYGMDDRQKPPKDKHLKVDHPNVNGIQKSAISKTWQNTEEEEFNWEDMAPASGDSGRTNDLFSSSIPPANFGKRGGFGTYPEAPLGASDFRNNWSKQAQLPVLNGTTPRVEVSAINSGRIVNNKVPGFHNENMPQTILQSSQHHFSMKESGRASQIPFSGNGIPSSAEQKPTLVGNFPNADAQIRGLSTMLPTLGPSFDSMSHETKPAAIPASVGVLPPVNMQSSYHQASLASPLKHEKFGNQTEIAGHLVTNMSKLPGQQLGVIESNSHNHIPQFLNHHHGLNSLNQQVHMNLLQPQAIPSQEARQNMIPPFPFLAPPPSVRPTLNHGYVSQAHRVPIQIGTVLPNLIPSVQSSMPIPSTVNGSLSQGFPPASSKMLPISQNPGSSLPNPPGGGVLSGLFDSLMAQGLISLTKEAPVQNSVVLDFNLDLLKVRHESSITALYADLPRQCTACGLRFKCQEAHSNHMDWHVTRNRNISKNRKQRPSRKWFASVDTWLSSAEALGADAMPGLLPVETTVEKNDDEEMAVPADDDQKVCSLCGEPFDDFYSDETDEWMYKGAVYLNAPTGSTYGMDRSQFGPIVHYKCRSETSGACPQDFQKDEGEYTEEGSDRKRLRS